MMGYVTLIEGVLRNFAKAVGEIDWAAEDRLFLGMVTAQSKYSSHMERGAFIDLVRTAVQDEIRKTKSLPQGISEDAFREYSAAERTVIRSGRPYVFGEKRDFR